MKENFDKCMDFVLRMEGGDAAENDPNDSGGLTKFGISQKAYPNLDIANLTKEAAIELYRKDYWNPCSCDDLPYPLCLCVFDCAVNQGVSKSKRLLQMALGVDVDGIIGPKTLSAAAKITMGRTKKLMALRIGEYARLMVANPNLLVFSTNWFYRVLSVAEVVFSKIDYEFS